jgi:hypothetical protein
VEVEDMVGRIVDLLQELDKFNFSLGVIAWTHALAPAFEHEYVRRLMEEKLNIDVFVKVSEVLKELNNKKERVQELMRDEEFMSYVESRFVKADEDAVKKEILDATSLLKNALAHYRLDNDELDEAKKLFNEVAEEYREIGDYENYLANRSWVLRVETIEGSLVGEKLVNEFRRLYEETFKEEHFLPTAKYLSTASSILGEYLVSLALTGNYETINELPEEHWWVLNAYEQDSALTRLMLNALLSPRGRLSSELQGKLSVNPEELINAFESDMYDKYLPALRVAFGMVRPEEGKEECESIKDSTERKDCKDAVSAVMDDSGAVEQLRGKFNALISEFENSVYGLDGKSLVQLFAPLISRALLALMLRALINGNKELAKALALYGGIYSSSKLLRRLFLEAYRACCDLGSESFRHAIVRLFFYHV